MRRTVIFALALFLFAGAAVCFAQGWQRTYGGSGRDWGKSVAQTTDGGYIVAGCTESFGAGSWDVYLVKTDALGDTIWTRTYGGSAWEEGSSVAQTTDGGYIVAGYTTSFGAGSYDVYLVKTDADGNLIWQRTYGGSVWEGSSSVAQTTDGGYIVAGGTTSFGAGGRDVYLVKTDALGETIWTRTYGGSLSDSGNSVAQTSDGGYIVAGDTESFGTGYRDIYLIKTDAAGDTIWTRTYGRRNYNEGYSVAQTADDGYIVAGLTESFGAGESAVYLVKTDALGNTIWQRTYGGRGEDVGYSVAQTTDGGYIVAGRYDYDWYEHTGDVYLVKTDAAGNEIWTCTYGGHDDHDDDYGKSVAQTTDGGYIVAGVTYSFGAGLLDVYLVKTDSLGFTAINEPSAQKPQSLSLSAYPNPFNSSVKITIFDGRGLACQTPTDIEIYDLRGNVVVTPYPAGAGFVPLNKGDRNRTERGFRGFVWQPDKTVPSGIYLVSARLGSYTTTKRIVYLK